MNKGFSVMREGRNQLLVLGTLTVLLSTFTQSTWAQNEPSREPILRIETGMHNDAITSLDVDANGRYLVTGSGERIVRVWELPAGRLLRVIRAYIPDKPGSEIDQVSISPDGLTIAAAMPDNDGGKPSLYFFDRDSGRLIRRLPNMGFGKLTFSKDNHYLANFQVQFTSTEVFGVVRVFDLQSYTMVGEDKVELPVARCAALTGVTGGGGVAFDQTNKLVTAFCDRIRLYALEAGGKLKLLVKKPTADEAPVSVEFSPDSSRIAISYRISATDYKVRVLSAKDLSELYTPNTTGMAGRIPQIFWSYDGKTLYAGNLRFGKNFVRAWDDGGRGEYRDIAIGGGLPAIKALRDGGFVYSSEFGIVGADGQEKLLITRNAIKLNNLCSPTYDAIRFNLSDEVGTNAQFSPSSLNLELPLVSSSSLGCEASYITKAEQVPENLRGVFNNIIQKQGLPAITPDHQGIIVGGFCATCAGSGYGLRLYGQDGTLRWEVKPSSFIYRLVVSGDARFVVALHNDGAVRWYRMADGHHVLTFFLHRDKKRWVVWTPSGYYAASPGAEDLVGWHVNNGKDAAADFFPVGQFRSTFYRPDVISKVLATGDEAAALRVANEEGGRKVQAVTVTQMLPPVVEINSPADNSEVSSSEVTIRYALRTPSGEAVTSVRALVDGRPVTGNRQLVREDASASGVRELKLSVPERDSEVSIIAENKFATSVPATIRLRWHGSAPTAESFVIQPKLYVLAIGVSQYQNPSYSLKFAAKDAKDFAAAAGTQKGFLYRDVVVKVLTDAQATKDEVLDGLDWIRKETTSKDVAMVFFAGHGLNDQNGVYYFLPYNVDLDKLLRTGVPFTDIKNTVQSLAGKTLFFIDTCHSGNVLGGRRGIADDLNGVINELASAESGAVVFAASTGSQYSLEDAKWNNGAFTKALVEGFTGRADYTGKGKITVNMLDLYISERVKELTGGKQTPTTAKPNTVPDFPIAVKR